MESARKCFILILPAVFEKGDLKVMKKHFTGIALFVFIIGISGFIANLFIEIPKPEIFGVQNTVPVYESRTRCSKQSRYSEQLKVITDAVYNEKTKQLYTTFAFGREHNHVGKMIDLNFFVKDGNKTRFLMTEKVIAERVDWESVSQTSSFKWLTDRTSRENLYIIAECEGKSPVFDADKATAVLIVEK